MPEGEIWNTELYFNIWCQEVNYVDKFSFHASSSNYLPGVNHNLCVIHSFVQFCAMLLDHRNVSLYHLIFKYNERFWNLRQWKSLCSFDPSKNFFPRSRIVKRSEEQLQDEFPDSVKWVSKTIIVLIPRCI